MKQHLGQQCNAIASYNANAETFAHLAGDRAENAYEYEVNLPSLVRLGRGVVGRTLDFGCGSGAFTPYFVREDRSLLACDGSPALVEIARSNNPDLEVFCWDGLRPYRSSQRVNFVIAKLVLHYIVDIEQVMGNISDMVEPGGYFLMSVPHPDKTAAMVVPGADEQIFEDEIGKFGLVFQMVHRSKVRYNAVFENAGFTSLRVDEPGSADGPSKRLNVLYRKQS